jgi:hypothetical protein
LSAAVFVALGLIACSADITSPAGGGGQGAGDGAGAGVDTCEAMVTPPVGTDVRVRFVNATDRVLYEGFELGACGDVYPLEVADGNVTLVQGLPCGTCQHQGCSFGCTIQEVVAIEPGGYAEEVWPGLIIRPGVPIPDACRERGTTCSLEEVAAEPLLLRGSLYTERLEYERVGGERLDVEITWTPGQSAIDLIFR